MSKKNEPQRFEKLSIEVDIERVPGKTEIVLEEPCWNCTTQQVYSNWSEAKEPFMKERDGSCGHCGGTHMQITEVGQGILNFVRKHFNGR